jgi:hypothetical protein
MAMRSWPIGLLLITTLAAAAPANDAELVGIVRLSVAAAPTNFDTLRSPVFSSQADERTYKSTAEFAKRCPDCAIHDKFANASLDEHWNVRFHWDTNPAWSKEQLDAYVLSTFGPLFPGATLTRESASGQEYFAWSRDKLKQFIYVITDTDAHGFVVVVGHYLASNEHVVRFSRGLTTADRDALTKSVRNFLTVASAGADTNFASLLGKQTNADTYALNMGFGEVLADCRAVKDIVPNPSPSNQSTWFVSCATPSIGGPAAQSATELRDAVSAGLPSGFTPTTDPVQLVGMAYRWDRKSDNAMIFIRANAYDQTGATTVYDLEVDHFLPLP